MPAGPFNAAVTLAGTVTGGTYRYEYYAGGRTFWQAESRCAARGGHLASLLDEAEQQAVALGFAALPASAWPAGALADGAVSLVAPVALPKEGRQQRGASQ